MPLIRRGTDDDLPHLTRLMAQAVRATGPSTYTSAEINAWWGACDEATVRASAQGGETWVVETGGDPVAFMVLRGDVIDLLYTDPDQARRGHATRLVEHAKMRRRRLVAEASHISRPVFERAGFRDDGPVARDLGGVLFTNRRMLWP